MGMYLLVIWEIFEFFDLCINRGIFFFFLNVFLSGWKFGKNKIIKRIWYDFKWCLWYVYNVMFMDMVKDLFVV